MNILIFTRSAWDNTNSTGNTMTNFFSGINQENIANIYIRDAQPKNNVCKYYYSVSDKEVLKSIYKRNYRAGKSYVFDYEKVTNTNIKENNKQEECLYNFFRKRPSILGFWAQEMLWKIGKWKNKKMDDFLNEFKPDIIFFPAFHTRYTHEILWYIKEKTNAKVVLFHADDYLNVSNYNKKPLVRINDKFKANVIKKSAEQADLNYCISPKQQTEYSNLLNRKMKLLYKGADFSYKPTYERNTNNLIRIVYVGSILYGRWRTLAMLSQAIYKINTKKPMFELKIYSQYEPSKEILDKMIIDGASEFKGKIPSENVNQAFKNSDIVLHIESFEQIEKLSTRLSFSTKIVDCLNSGRCLMAIGWNEAASIDYLLQNEAALVATSEKEISQLLTEIVNDSSIISEYAGKAWECGRKNHQIDDIQENLYNDLKMLVEDRSYENNSN